MKEKSPSMMMMMVTENIEMELFSSGECCAAVSVLLTEEDYCSYYVNTPPQQQFKLKRVPSVRIEDLDDCPLVPDLKEDMEIELEVFPPLNTPQTELVVKPSPSFTTPGKERAVMGMTARITIYCGWTASEMKSRLVSHFQRQLGTRFSFTYLQCGQGSRALFVPDPPVEGWTGEQVLRICGHDPLYILIHRSGSQAESDWSEGWTQAGVKRKEFPLDVSMESCRETRQDRVNLPQDYYTKEDLTAELDSVLRTFRSHAVDPSLQCKISPLSWSQPLLGALRTLGRPGFCSRATPVVSSSDTEVDGDGRQGNLTEFFRRALLELQHSSVFEGPPGRLFLTYDLAALEDGKYYKAGVLIGWSLAHGGPGPQCIHPAFYQLMCGQNAPLDDFDWRDVADPDAQVRLKRLHSFPNMELSDSLWVKSCGLPEKDPADLSSIYARLVKQCIYHRVASMVTQLTDGLDSCGGLWGTVRAHWEAFMPVMTSMGQKTPSDGD
ncbi:hypothetical protein NHX12_032974 [Muraenolepis orangiensis]|uniref:Uncharacterized protein n=1 Tax=Muraenolepis orangiensis TaxID=630683 RepID=A0A9Q0E483_9TELE|nr:hypothetical protein NHX12_032974 [Muraenolepis orangiensis]